ncbi:hypothetical protein T492DRAFT_586746 [Pavlovales sp. CCMP2436]|nr:hypothetical protein T492DRAFT_586746 [Pavlovales sp. CCMP2436]
MAREDGRRCAYRGARQLGPDDCTRAAASGAGESGRGRAALPACTRGAREAAWRKPPGHARLCEQPGGVSTGHPDTLTSVNNLAALIQAPGKLAEAEPLYRRALDEREKQLGASHPDTLTSGKLAEAEPLYRCALAGREKQLGASHPSTLASVNNLGRLLKAQGKLGEAEPLLRPD